MDVHVERERENEAKVTDGIDVWEMWCGAQCLVMPDGHLEPEGFDFYGEAYAEKATCEACKAVLYGTAATACREVRV